MSLDEACVLRSKLVGEVYPELCLYLHEDQIDAMARNVHATSFDTWRALWKHKRNNRVAAAIRSVIQGRIVRQDGTTYSEGFVHDVWSGLAELCDRGGVDEELRELVAKCSAASLAGQAPDTQATEKLHNRIFGTDCITLTGRVRSGISFTKARNTPFSGLAADGAKLALWNLTRAGYTIVCFVHDEIVIQLPESSNVAAEARAIEQIAIRSMQELTGDIPITCKCALTRRWSKEVQRIVDPATGDLLVAGND
jgi:hypothetical protein